MTRETLVKKIEWLAKYGGGIGPFTLDHNDGGYRLTCGSGSRDISPRLKPKEMVLYLNAMIDMAWELERAGVINQPEVKHETD